MALTLRSDIVGNGVNQGDLVDLLTNIKELLNELQADHATNKTVIDELKTDYTALLADVTAIRTSLIATTAKLDADATVTDANYGSLNNPAALTATAIAASSAATLTNNTAITLLKG